MTETILIQKTSAVGPSEDMVRTNIGEGPGKVALEAVHPVVPMLTAYEYKVFCLLKRHENDVVFRIELAEFKTDNSNTIEVIISRIRKKLAKVDPDLHIICARGVGYELRRIPIKQESATLAEGEKGKSEP